MSLRSPLGKVLGHGASKEGAGHWWAQRLSAVALVVLAPWFLLSLISIGDLSYLNVQGWIASPLSTVLLSLLVLALTYHAYLGLQVVIEDYVADQGVRLVVLVLVKFSLLVTSVLGVISVLRIAFMGNH